MDQLNKLRLMAGIPVNLSSMVTPKQKLVEYQVPVSKDKLSPKSEQTMKARVALSKEALEHLQKALAAIKKIPATDFDGTLAHYNHELESLINGDNGESGFAATAKRLDGEYRSWKRHEGKRVRMEQEESTMMDGLAGAIEKETELTKRSDCCKFEVGQAVKHFDQPMIVAIANTDGDMVGIAPPGQDTDVKAVVIVPADELTADQESDESDANDDMADSMDMPSDEEMDNDQTNDPEIMDQVASDELVPPQRIAERVNYYYNTDEQEPNSDLDHPGNVADGSSNSDQVWKKVKKATDKDESPAQLHKLGAASNTEAEKKVRIPAAVKTAMQDAIAEVEAHFPKLGATETDAKFFYKSLAMAFKELWGHIEGGTVRDIKNAQIFMSTLMGPIMHKIPAVVVNFVAKGGETPSLKDYMKPVDPMYPITGPRQHLK